MGEGEGEGEGEGVEVGEGVPGGILQYSPPHCGSQLQVAFGKQVPCPLQPQSTN